ncbi:helix-turn-helix domain-containing protein [Deinococcus sp. SL84]|uniref:helix-turn-helix domain-containing protein n=1 Tax=Deinococcus sp. SL84 TaxID=2994663 RepID=UPI0022734B99|nr:helix-turn-helix transcriptional regulator [Deinococcus sp. SL84]MCY1703572.1 helix-turn-helix transcriptional regulator [Deinococcus sp. SL84]
MPRRKSDPQNEPSSLLAQGRGVVGKLRPGPKTDSTPPPAVIENAEHRGHALRYWLHVQGFSQTQFQQRVGIGRTTLNRYLNGETDLAVIKSETADKLLRVMGIRDTDAWEILGIPSENRSTFRSTRPWPLGHGPSSQVMADTNLITLEHSLFGSLALPAGSQLEVTRGTNTCRHQIYRLENGMLYAVDPNTPVPPNGEHLGGLLAAHFETD